MYGTAPTALSVSPVLMGLHLQLFTFLYGTSLQLLCLLCGTASTALSVFPVLMELHLQLLFFTLAASTSPYHPGNAFVFAVCKALHLHVQLLSFLCGTAFVAVVFPVQDCICSFCLFYTGLYQMRLLSFL